MARNLQDCLAFASFKAQNGWQDRTLKSIEPEITEQLKRKRPVVDEDILSDGSLSSSEDFVPTSSIATNRFSKPNTSFKMPEQPYNTSRKRVRSVSNADADRFTTGSWKQNANLPQSSPALGRTFTDNHPFGSELPHSSQEDSPMFDVHTDEEDHDLPLHSFNEPSSSIISSSPPRTPPPTRRINAVNAKQSGADLLLFLANSPSRSPAVNITLDREAPSTPPSQHTHLPSSVMNTPGTNLGLFNGALQTPGQNFNFADFCNVTPSPGQAQWGGRTPLLSKTPRRLARHSLNFDTLQPPTSSPSMQRKQSTTQGLALQLGEELLPRS